MEALYITIGIAFILALTGLVIFLLSFKMDNLKTSKPRNIEFCLMTIKKEQNELRNLFHFCIYLWTK